VVKLLWTPRRRDQREKEVHWNKSPAPHKEGAWRYSGVYFKKALGIWRWEARSADSPLVSPPRIAHTTVLYTDRVYITVSEINRDLYSSN